LATEPTPSDVAVQRVNGLKTTGCYSVLVSGIWDFVGKITENEFRIQANTISLSVFSGLASNKISSAFVMPMVPSPLATEYEIAWVLTRQIELPDSRSCTCTGINPLRSRNLNRKKSETDPEQWDSVQQFFQLGRARNFRKSAATITTCRNRRIVSKHFRAFLAKQLEREIILEKIRQECSTEMNPYRGLHL
jgi:hypothetical protein